MGIFSSSTKKRRVSKDVRKPKAPKQPAMGASKASWDKYQNALVKYNQAVDKYTREVNRREALKNAKVKIDAKKSR